MKNLQKISVKVVKPPPISIVDIFPKRCHSKWVLNPFQNRSAVAPARIHALQFMCAFREKITLVNVVNRADRHHLINELFV